MIYYGFIEEVLSSNRGDVINHSGSKIMYRIINFDDLLFFAQEISTGCLFPIIFKKNYGCSETKLIANVSYLESGKYYVYCPLKVKEGDLFRFSLDEENLLKEVELPSNKDVNEYLYKYRRDFWWKDKIKQKEVENRYMCALNLIKENIFMSGYGVEKLSVDLNRIKTNSISPKTRYINYSTSIDIEPIKDMGYDLSTQSDLCNLIGREEEIKRIIKTIAIKGKSVILLGEPGAGKTSIVEKLALDIRNGNCIFLEDKIIFSLSTAALVSGTKFRGEFEQKLQEFIEFCKKHKGEIIIFIDEIHALCGLGSAGGSIIDARNVLKPYISNGDITIIGATTKMEYEKYMANDPAFLRRFENVEISLPDKKMNIEIMLAYIIELEEKYGIKLDLSLEQRLLMVEQIFEVTDGKCTYVTGTIKIENPTLSKNILENAFVEAIYNRKQIVTIEDINLSILEYNKLSLEFISEYGYDLSEQKNLCNLVGREKELERIVKGIAIEEKSVLLVGEPGTGKTSIVEKIALDIKNGDCEFLDGKTIFCLNVASLTAGTGIRGEFEDKMNKLVNICKKNKGKVILFIDEIHTLYGLGRTTDSSIDAMNILKPYISNGDITIIGATTKMEYEKYMANDPAFLRRFEKVDISPLAEEDKIQVLISHAKDLEVSYSLKMNLSEISLYQLMQYIVKITELECQNVKGDIKVENPTISKQLIENAFSDAKYHKKECVTIEDIIFAILECDKLSLDFRKRCAENLKEYIEFEDKPREVYVPRLVKSGCVGFSY